MRAARSMVIDHTQGTVEIDGVPFPYFIEEGGPEVRTEQGALNVVTFGVFVDGYVTIKTVKGPQIVDPREGEVGDWARRMVREGLLERLPWLRGVEA